MSNQRNLRNSGIFVLPPTTVYRSFADGEYRVEPFRKDVDNVVCAALRLGVNTFDTAEKCHSYFYYPPVNKLFGTILAERDEQAYIILSDTRSRVQYITCKSKLFSSDFPIAVPIKKNSETGFFYTQKQKQRTIAGADFRRRSDRVMTFLRKALRHLYGVPSDIRTCTAGVRDGPNGIRDGPNDMWADAEKFLKRRIRRLL